jgi:amidase
LRAQVVAPRDGLEEGTQHLGTPTVTVPMGTMADIGMPVGPTLLRRAYDDTALLTLAAHWGAAHRATPDARPRA